MGASGVADLDFGAWPGNTVATVAITGQSGIGTSSRVEAWIEPADSTDHSSDEHILAGAVGLRAVAADRVAGTGFTIYLTFQPILEDPINPPLALGLGVGRKMYGVFKVGWVWA